MTFPSWQYLVNVPADVLSFRKYFDSQHEQVPPICPVRCVCGSGIGMASSFNSSLALLCRRDVNVICPPLPIINFSLLTCLLFSFCRSCQSVTFGINFSWLTSLLFGFWRYCSSATFWSNILPSSYLWFSFWRSSQSLTLCIFFLPHSYFFFSFWVSSTSSVPVTDGFIDISPQMSVYW